MFKNGIYVRVTKPGDQFHNRVGVIVDESPYSINPKLGQRYIIKFSDSPFGFGFEEEYLKEVTR